MLRHYLQICENKFKFIRLKSSNSYEHWKGTYSEFKLISKFQKSSLYLLHAKHKLSYSIRRIRS